MKIRNGYVSNSSSSSFVLNSCKDLEAVSKIITDSFSSLVNDKYWKHYHLDLNKLESSLQESIKNRNNINTMRMYLFNLFYYVIMHYSYYYNKYLSLKENDACIGCPLMHHHKCYFRSRKKEQEICYWKSDYKSYLRERKNALLYLNDFPQHFPLYLFKECRKQMNNNIKIFNSSDGNKCVYASFDFEKIKPMIEKEVEKWIKKNPKSCFLEFSSDNGNKCQAVLRYNLEKYVNQSKEKGIKGFYSDNS